MVLAGKLITELGIKTPADKFYKLFASELHEVQNYCERVHHTKLHEGEDWHHSDTVKHWTYVIEVINKADGTAAVKWTIDYVKINEDVDTPNGWMDYLSKSTRDIDGHLLKGERVAL
ncbi:hypothetical protein KIW84_044650 [Lathyrus oleraceus]|uniref:Bet v I/Major latex protein domain-containing protein n=1 Tax=Pisum sativum TaxID=3888 RepID=A0A9D4XJ04_PEA|nr:hypothetical protein KIW84_044650 [Pisum sativum]